MFSVKLLTADTDGRRYVSGYVLMSYEKFTKLHGNQPDYIYINKSKLLGTTNFKKFINSCTSFYMHNDDLVLDTTKK